MKGWQNQLAFSQKINCTKETASKIIAFESIKFLETWNDGFIKLNIKLLDCCSLKHLIDALRFNFLKLYKGQVLIIAYEILLHLNQLHSNNLNNLSHGQLDPKNIFISLKSLKNNKFTIYQVPLYIQKINFVNYKLIEDQNYQINQLEDIKQIILSLQQFIESIEDYQQCQLLQIISQQMKLIQSNINQNSLTKLIDLFNILIQQNVDQQTQQIKKGTYKESPNWESSLGYRYRSEKTIMEYIERLSVWDLNFRIEIKKTNDAINNQDQPNNIENERILFEEENINEDDLKIKQTLLDNLRNNIIMINFWSEIGTNINNWVFVTKDTFKKFEDKINMYLNSLRDWFRKIQLTKDNLANKFPKQMIDEIAKQFKFEIQVDIPIEQQIVAVFIQYLQFHMSNFDIINGGDLDLLLQQIKEEVTQDVRKYYDSIKNVKILELINELI